MSSIRESEEVFLSTPFPNIEKGAVTGVPPARQLQPQPSTPTQQTFMQSTLGQVETAQYRAHSLSSMPQPPLAWFGGGNSSRPSYPYSALPVVCSRPQASCTLAKSDIDMLQPDHAASLDSLYDGNSFSHADETPLSVIEPNSVPAYVDDPQRPTPDLQALQPLPHSSPHMTSFPLSPTTTGSFTIRFQNRPDSPRPYGWEQYAKRVTATHRYRCTYSDCPRGDRPFPGRKAIEQHIKGTHLLIRAHVCSIPECGRRFSRLFDLRRHLRSHAPDRPFVCRTCGIAYKRSDMLIRHQTANVLCQQHFSGDEDG